MTGETRNRKKKGSTELATVSRRREARVHQSRSRAQTTLSLCYYNPIARRRSFTMPESWIPGRNA
jgi:hypothetical protein